MPLPLTNPTRRTQGKNLLIDLLSRVGLLAAAAGVAVRSAALLRTVSHPGRRAALIVTIPPAASLVWFEANLLIHVPLVDGALAFPVWQSRAVMFLSLISWIVVQQVILTAELHEQGQL